MRSKRNMWGVTLGKSLPSLGLSFPICKYGVRLGLALMYGVDVRSSQQSLGCRA